MYSDNKEIKKPSAPNNIASMFPAVPVILLHFCDRQTCKRDRHSATTGIRNSVCLISNSPYQLCAMSRV